MSRIKLKPCPFCRQTKHLEIMHSVCYFPDEHYYCHVYCHRCEALIYGAKCDTPEEAEASAVKRWNTRYEEQEDE